MIKQIPITSSEVCSHKCFGVDNYHGGCCTIENRDFIIGPIRDAERFANDLSIKLNRPISVGEVTIDYIEGRQLFPDKSVWQNPGSYPAMRINTKSLTKECIFYNNHMKACMVYEIRPETCQTFKCEYLQNHVQSEI